MNANALSTRTDRDGPTKKGTLSVVHSDNILTTTVTTQHQQQKNKKSIGAHILVLTTNIPL